MSEFIVDEKSEGFKIGVEIGILKTKILKLPLEELLGEANYWELITPLMNPTLYMKHREVMADFIKNLRILASAKRAFLQTEEELN